MTSKQRSFLKSISSNYDSLFQVGKQSITPEIIDAISEALEARELIKISVLKNCDDDLLALANAIAENTDAIVVQVIGRKIVLYRQARKPENRKIKL